MRNRKFLSIFLGAVVAGSFAVGLFEPELRAQGGLPESIFSIRPSGNGKELEPANTYSRVLKLVNESYYNEVPSDLKLTYAAIRGLLNSLDDPYTRFLDPEEYNDLRQENDGSFEGIGAHLDPRPTKEGYIRIIKPLGGGPADQAGVKRGDLITHVDSRSVVGMTVDQAVKIIRGKANTPVTLTLVRSGEAKALVKRIVRRPVEFEVVDAKMLDGDIGYVSLSQFNEMADVKMERAIRQLETKGMKGLVVDLRGNPGGLLDAAIEISSRFVPGNKDAVIIEEAGGDRDHRKTDARKFLNARWPVVILINRTSASASEIVAGAVKDHGVGRLVGTTTFGKGLVQTVVPLENGAACMITTAKWMRPSGKDINRTRDQRGGVEPDVVVEVTEEEWLKGEDPQLARAKEEVRRLVQSGGAPAAASAR
jgi:carboxyl-terminal processing protease